MIVLLSYHTNGCKTILMSYGVGEGVLVGVGVGEYVGVGVEVGQVALTVTQSVE